MSKRDWPEAWVGKALEVEGFERSAIRTRQFASDDKAIVELVAWATVLEVFNQEQGTAVE